MVARISTAARLRELHRRGPKKMTAAERSREAVKVQQQPKPLSPEEIETQKAAHAAETARLRAEVEAAIYLVLERLEAFDASNSELLAVAAVHGRRQAILEFLGLKAEGLKLYYYEPFNRHFSYTLRICAVDEHVYVDHKLEGAVLDYLCPPRPDTEGDRLQVGDVVTARYVHEDLHLGHARYLGDLSSGQPDLDPLSGWTPGVFDTIRRGLAEGHLYLERRPRPSES